MILRFEGNDPAIATDAYVAPGAQIMGRVRLEAGASVWFNAVLRGDDEPITVGENSNVQDNATLHIDPGHPVVVGKSVVIGHNAIVHGATIEDEVLIGMHATVLTGARIGRGSIVGAGALVPEGVTIPPNSLVVGIPAKVVRSTTPDQVAGIRRSAAGLPRPGGPLPPEWNIRPMTQPLTAHLPQRPGRSCE